MAEEDIKKVTVILGRKGQYLLTHVPKGVLAIVYHYSSIYKDVPDDEFFDAVDEDGVKCSISHIQWQNDTITHTIKIRHNNGKFVAGKTPGVKVKLQRRT